jgi:hypothetical protein
MDGRPKGQQGGQKEERKEGSTFVEGRKDGQKEGRKEKTF